MEIIIKALFIVLIALTAAQLSSSSQIENEAQLTLAARVDGLQFKVDQLVIQLEEEKLLRRNFQSLNAELEKKIHQLAEENAQKNEQFEDKINILTTQNVHQEEDIRRLKNIIRKDGLTLQPNSSIHDDEDHRPMINDEAVGDLISNGPSPRLPPSSCRQLSTIGHYLDGIYLVANPDTNKIESVYCDFGSSTLSETLYGSVDVKTKSVHFFVQRSTSFTLIDDVLPFEIERLNVGGAMNIETGVFTVPLNGIYHFQFSALKVVNAPANAYIYLQVNGDSISTSYAPSELSSYLTLSVINASLKLKTGDQVRLYGNGSIADSTNRYTHFTGWLVEEELTLA